MVWKTMLNSFSLIGQNILIGKDHWIGCGNNHLLPKQAIHSLNDQGIFNLNQIWLGHWISWHEVGMWEDLAQIWDTYTTNIQNSYIKLTDQED
jgi:hypothetical protein